MTLSNRALYDAVFSWTSPINKATTATTIAAVININMYKPTTVMVLVSVISFFEFEISSASFCNVL